MAVLSSKSLTFHHSIPWLSSCLMTPCPRPVPYPRLAIGLAASFAMVGKTKRRIFVVASLSKLHFVPPPLPHRGSRMRPMSLCFSTSHVPETLIRPSYRYLQDLSPQSPSPSERYQTWFGEITK